MWCPQCDAEKTKVAATITWGVVQRWRICNACGHTFSTVEIIKTDKSWQDDARYTLDEFMLIINKKTRKGEHS